MVVRNLGRKLTLGLLLAVGVVAALALYGDVQALRLALGRFTWGLALPILALTGLNLWLRFQKWAFYLRLLEAAPPRRSDSVAIFLANYALIITPGKVGGFMKSWFLRRCAGVPLARSSPIIVAERLTDGLGLVGMVTLALALYPSAWPVVVALLAAMALLVGGVQQRPLALWALGQSARLPWLGRHSATLAALYESCYALLRPRPLLWATLLGTLARATEGVALALVLWGLGVPLSLPTLGLGLFIAALSNIVGVLVMLPGGLGGTEASMAGLLGLFVGLAPGPATAATLLTRVATFWVPALLGFAALALWRGRFFGADDGAAPHGFPEPEGRTPLSL